MKRISLNLFELEMTTSNSLTACKKEKDEDQSKGKN